jgi:hypothetical protein
VTTGSAGAGGPPHRGAQPGQQLVHAERLGHVIVRARIQRGHLLALLAPRRQHDDRGGRPAAHAPDHVGAVHVRQAEVQDEHVRALAGHGGQPRGAVGGRADLVLARGQVDPQRVQDRRLVVDDQDLGRD